MYLSYDPVLAEMLLAMAELNMYGDRFEMNPGGGNTSDSPAMEKGLGECDGRETVQGKGWPGVGDIGDANNLGKQLCLAGNVVVTPYYNNPTWQKLKRKGKKS